MPNDVKYKTILFNGLATIESQSKMRCVDEKEFCDKKSKELSKYGMSIECMGTETEKFNQKKIDLIKGI